MASLTIIEPLEVKEAITELKHYFSPKWYEAARLAYFVHWCLNFPNVLNLQDNNRTCWNCFRPKATVTAIMVDMQQIIELILAIFLPVTAILIIISVIVFIQNLTMMQPYCNVRVKTYPGIPRRPRRWYLLNLASINCSQQDPMIPLYVTFEERLRHSTMAWVITYLSIVITCWQGCQWPPNPGYAWEANWVLSVLNMPTRNYDWASCRGIVFPTGTGTMMVLARESWPQTTSPQSGISAWLTNGIQVMQVW